MALKEKIVEKEDKTSDAEDELSTEEKQHLSIMVNLAKNLIDDGGNQVITAAMKSRDPGQVIGQFLVQLAQQIAEKLEGKVDVSPRIILIEDGWVEQVSDYLQEEYGIDKATADRAELYIGAVGMKQAQAMQQEAAGGAVPPADMAPEQQAVLPQQAPPQGMM